MTTLFDSDLVNSYVDIGVHTTETQFIVYHLKIKKELRGNRIGSSLIESIKQIATGLQVESVEVHIKGGSRSREFLESNDFDIIYIESEDEEGLVIGRWFTRYYTDDS